MIKRRIFCIGALLLIAGVALRVLRVPGRLRTFARNLKYKYQRAQLPPGETSHGWRKSKHNPVLGGALGTCFDVSLLRENNRFHMWFSWRPQKSIARVESPDGIHWSEPVVALEPNQTTNWEANINRPSVLKRPDGYHMWYTGQKGTRSWIGYATSNTGQSWSRMSKTPVLSAAADWEKVAVMAPHVLWDEHDRLYKMWYSGGEQYEPDAIGYATSSDGLTWSKHTANPIFRPERRNLWEQAKVTACQVLYHNDFYLMFYIGFMNQHLAQIGMARSPDGVNHWTRHPANPIIRVGVDQEAWDYDAVYKPFALHHDGHWLLWYNGRRKRVEQIGLALFEGDEVWPAMSRPS